LSTNRILEQLGVFFRPGFVKPVECRNLIAAIESTPRKPGGLYHQTEQVQFDSTIRQVSEVSGEVEGVGSLKERLRKLLPELAEHFRTPVEEIEGPTLLAYKPGDFFLPHSDSGEAGLVQGRIVTAVIYLNSPHSPAAGGYQGADLTLFGLMSFPGAENHGLPVEAETGLLVAFPSSLRHGVDKLVRGSRYCAVTWYR
jgi:predicted 2-oxoglutarate/Fe(II)-dependent dioxygenase YbiX